MIRSSTQSLIIFQLGGYKMASTNKGIQIVSDFIQAVNQLPNFSAARTTISRQVFETTGSKNCLLYVKSRSAHPFKWGATANVIDKLKSQDLPWFVILLFLSHKTGYLLSSNDVNYYIKSVWPLAADGDYKPAEGTYLHRNNPFNSVKECIDQL